MVVAAATAFSGKAVIIKLAYRHGIDAVTLLALRMVFSVPFFIAAALWVRSGTEHRPLAGRELAAVIGLGILSYYAASFLDFLALQYIPAGLGRLLLFTYPTIVVVLSAALLSKPVTRRELAALVITYTGQTWVDPLVAVLIGLWVVPRTWVLFRASVNILLEGVPDGLDLSEVRAGILAVPGVCGVQRGELFERKSADPRFAALASLGDDPSAGEEE